VGQATVSLALVEALQFCLTARLRPVVVVVQALSTLQASVLVVPVVPAAVVPVARAPQPQLLVSPLLVNQTPEAVVVPEALMVQQAFKL
jgi:hypothetical protein